jgi:hypothetical protein
MPVSDLTIELLKQIRDAAQLTNERLDQTNERLDQTNARLDQTRTEFLGKLDQTRVEFLEKLDQTRVEFLEKVDQTRVELGEKLDLTNARVGRVEHFVAEIVQHTGTLAERGGRLADDVAELRRRVEVLENARQ